jgi:hypothetical protein
LRARRRSVLKNAVRATVLLLGMATLLGACRCTPPLSARPEAEWVVAPNPLTLPTVYVGQRSTGALTVDNLGGVTATVDVAVDPPFSTSSASLTLGSGASERLVVEAVPTSAGTTRAVLRLGVLEVPVSVEALEVPPCRSTSCAEGRFDFTQGACVDVARPDGVGCDDGCVTGACHAGVCEGTVTACDDSDACTTDACGPNGCLHVPTQCPAAGPCTVPTCDALTGCSTTEAPDGTLCGADDCRATTVEVCIQGRCVTRPRPAAGRCVNTWVPGTIAARHRHALAWDEARGRVVLFGGYSSWGVMPETWEWNGTEWEIRTPTTSPPPVHRPAMTYDAARRRTVLVAPKHDRTSELWEWDGVTWVQRSPASASPPVHGDSNYVNVALAWDAVRRVTVGAFFKRGSSEPIDTWEWNGTAWRQRTPATVPHVYFGAGRLSWDGSRQRVVLTGTFSSQGNHLNAVWEWDGTDWVDRSATAAAVDPWGTFQEAPAWDATRRELVMKATGVTLTSDGTQWRSHPANGPEPNGGESPMVFDTVRRQLLLFDGSRTWTWDGARWSTLSDDRSPRLVAVVTDSVRQRVLGFGVDQPELKLWRWDQRGWVPVAAANAPPARVEFAVAFDAQRDRVVLFGGALGAGAETWEFDGTAWARRVPAHTPPAREKASMAYDAARQRVLLFGGERPGSGTFGDLWEWDGTDWALLATVGAAPSPRASTPLVWASTTQRSLLLGGAPAPGVFETWAWNGTWTQLAPAVPAPPRFVRTAAEDPTRQALVGIESISFDSLATWELTSTGWVARTPTVSPSTGAFPMYGAAWEPVGGHVLLSGVGQTWLFLP